MCLIRSQGEREGSIHTVSIVSHPFHMLVIYPLWLTYFHPNSNALGFNALLFSSVSFHTHTYNAIQFNLASLV